MFRNAETWSAAAFSDMERLGIGQGGFDGWTRSNENPIKIDLATRQNRLRNETCIRCRHVLSCVARNSLWRPLLSLPPNLL